MLERELTGKGLYEAIAGIMNDESGRKQMAEASRKLGKPDAAKVLVNEIKRLVAKR
ncbi:undecaprenyldiphospho-muramoylpentapeptide beta-N- acetylglucosaminyltransferase [compost metagenome]